MEWTRGEILGRGSFSAVNMAVRRRKLAGDLSPEIAAVKSCRISLSSILTKEKKILELLSGCPEIVSFYGDCISDESDGQYYNIFIEYVPGGNLRSLYRRRKVAGSELRRLAASILRGLKEIHKAGIVHCDIKPENILVNGGEVKIVDFGLAAVAGEAGGGEVRGTPMYIAPEVVRSGMYGAPCDVWAFGCVVAEMAAGRPVRKVVAGEDAAAMFFRVASGGGAPEIPAEVGEEGRDFLRRCFEEDPGERWTAEMLLEHRFLGGGEAAEESPRSVVEFASAAGEEERSCGGGEAAEESPRSVVEFAAAAERLRGLVGNGEGISGEFYGEGWVTVREAECWRAVI